MTTGDPVADEAGEDETPEPAGVEHAPVKVRLKDVRGPGFGHATYLGGAPNVRRRKSGNLFFNTDVIGIGTRRPRLFTLKTEAIRSIEITGQSFKRASQTQLAVRTKGGMTCFFQIDGTSPPQVRAKLAVWMRARGIVFFEDEQRSEFVAAVGHGAPSVADEIKKLAELRDQGVITEEQFDAQRDKLLG